MKFTEAERAILELFQNDTQFNFEGNTYKVNFAGKPSSPHGEPKTDIYIEAQDINTNKIREIKISYKKENADFVENKISKERAKQLFGDSWETKINEATHKLRSQFQAKKLIYKTKFSRTQAGSITLGWKFELTNKTGGKLSTQLELTADEVMDVYSGTNLAESKKNALVNGKIIENSGVANYMLVTNDTSSIEKIITRLQPISSYVRNNPNLFCVYKALNYRTFDNKYDGDRPLAVSVDWSIKNSKLSHNLNFSTPLTVGGNLAYNKLKCALNALESTNTEDLNEDNVINYNEITHE